MSAYTMMFVTIGVLLLCIGLSVCHVCNRAPGTNGCSIPGNLPYFFNDFFEAHCNKHDICYSCGQSRGISRRGCDDRFYRNMKRRCRTNKRVRKYEDMCKKISYTYYLGVRYGGSSRYNKKCPKWCSSSWVSQCLL